MMSDIEKKNFPVDLFARLLYPRHVVLVTCADTAGKPNVLPFSFSMPVSYVPPMVVISMDLANYSHELIMNSGEYVINVPDANLAEQTMLCGETSGRNYDKFAAAELTPIPAQIVTPPLIKECHAHLECRVRESIPAGDHTLFLADVVAASANDGIFDFEAKFPHFTRFKPLFSPIRLKSKPDYS